MNTIALRAWSTWLKQRIIPTGKEYVAVSNGF